MRYRILKGKTLFSNACTLTLDYHTKKALNGPMAISNSFIFHNTIRHRFNFRSVQYVIISELSSENRVAMFLAIFASKSSPGTFKNFRILLFVGVMVSSSLARLFPAIKRGDSLGFPAIR